MQNTNEIRHHIGAVEQTRKITNAMELISTARLKKVLNNIYYNNEYLSRVQSAMKDVLLSPHPVDHPYLNVRAGKKRLYIVIAGDKGMVGSYNDDILEFAYNEISGCRGGVILMTIGMVANEFFRANGIVPDREIAGLSQNPSLYNAQHLMLDIMDLYDSGKIRSAYIIYTDYNGNSDPKPESRRILPIRLNDFKKIEQSEPEHEIMYVPSANTVFELLVPQYLVGILFGALVHSYASELSARTAAMSSATDNADELLKKLKLQYNTARQSAITQEIAEISGSSELLNSEVYKK